MKTRRELENEISSLRDDQRKNSENILAQRGEVNHLRVRYQNAEDALSNYIGTRNALSVRLCELETELSNIDKYVDFYGALKLISQNYIVTDGDMFMAMFYGKIMFNASPTANGGWISINDLCVDYPTSTKWTVVSNTDKGTK
jgi:hypothetical protein